MNAGQGIYAVLWISPREYRSSRTSRYCLLSLRYRSGHKGVAEQNQEHDHYAQHRPYLTSGQLPIRSQSPRSAIQSGCLERPASQTYGHDYFIPSSPHLGDYPATSNSLLEQPHVA